MSTEYINIKEAQDNLFVDDMSTELYGYDCNLGDAITEIADSNISIYYQDQIDFAKDYDNSEYIRNAYIPSMDECFERNSNDSVPHYLAHIGAAGMYEKNCQIMYGELDNALTWVTLETLKEEYGVQQISQELFEQIQMECEDIDTNRTIKDVVSDAMVNSLDACKHPENSFITNMPEKCELFLRKHAIIGDDVHVQSEQKEVDNLNSQSLKDCGRDAQHSAHSLASQSTVRQAFGHKHQITL